MNKDDVFAALDRLENDALASRDGYGDARKDAEIIRAALTAKQSINAQLVGALKEWISLYIGFNENELQKRCDPATLNRIDITKQALAAAQKEGV